MPKNMEKLGNTLHGQIARVNKANRKTTIELGVLTGSMSLRPDLSPGPIGRREYSVCRSIADTLGPGDRVLICWCGTEPVIVDATS